MYCSISEEFIKNITTSFRSSEEIGDGGFLIFLRPQLKIGCPFLEFREYLNAPFQYSIHMCYGDSVVRYWQLSIFCAFQAVFHFAFV